VRCPWPLFTLLPALLAAGCGVERTLRLESTPPGALVYLNGEEVARTPAEVPLEWYGKYDVAVRLDGYETLKDERWVVAPWWQWPPIDLVAELLPLPLRDRRRLSFVLRPEGRRDEGVLDRGEAMRASQITN
jgi:hypothetical protein